MQYLKFFVPDISWNAKDKKQRKKSLSGQWEWDDIGNDWEGINLKKDKTCQGEIFFLNDTIDQGEIKVKYSPTKQM